jgi:hypothetical protein
MISGIKLPGTLLRHRYKLDATMQPPTPFNWIET